MEVDTNELLHRIGSVLRVISDKMDHLIEAANDHFAGADKMVVDEPPASEKPPKPEYREPVLPADAGQPCQFSMTGKDWYEGLLAGFQVHNTHPWISSNLGCWKYARIKKES